MVKIMSYRRTLVPPMHTLPSSAFQSYLGTFLKEYKEASIKDVEIESPKIFDVVHDLYDP